MPMHPRRRDPAVTLQEDREAIILADRLGFYDAYVGEHLTDPEENVTNSFIFLASVVAEPHITNLDTDTSHLAHTHALLLAAHRALFDLPARGRSIPGISPGTRPSYADASVIHLPIA